MQFNRSNLKLYAGGTRPFIGDFIDVAGLVYLTQQINQTTAWVPNDGSNPSLATTAAQTFYAFWTDNRDAKVGSGTPEPDSDTAEGQALLVRRTWDGRVLGGRAQSPDEDSKLQRLHVADHAGRVRRRADEFEAVGQLEGPHPACVPRTSEEPHRHTADVPADHCQPATRLRTGTGIATFVQVPSPIPSPLPAPVASTDVIIPPIPDRRGRSTSSSSVKYPQISVNVVEQ